MRLVYIFAAILAVSVVESSDENKIYDDLEAMATMELKKEKRELIPEASAYNYVPQQTWQNYVPQNQNYIPNNNYNTNAPYVPPVTASPPYVPPVTASPPYVPPVTSSPTYVPSVTSSPSYVPSVQSDYVAPQNYEPYRRPGPRPPSWATTSTFVPTTTPVPTTSVAVIKNEQNYGDNGSYNYEYQIADGTHVRQEGYFSKPEATDDSLVQRGFYSFVGGDGKTYTVFYWADKTGYHAYGDHLPTPSPAIQAALDAEKNKPTTAAPIYYPQPQPTYPPQQIYYPPQQTYPQQTYPQQTYPQQTYYPPQQPSNPGYGK